ncbi:MAG: type II toxin-antitoxin system RelE/ParE family toxin [Defluviicoccus sp.]|nr:type II toxin-antitoxin system RelE/ParE family toxin [Defluviicoccus sp.]MDE0279439.1 type II toxin-antitoxin system RelE/ParE family toxin [Defluviicoccus sp.]
MTSGVRRWRIRLTAAARDDIRNVLLWTSERFGEAQARRYAGTLVEAIQTLEEGPDVPGSRRRDEISQGLMTLHVARRGRTGRHLVVYRTGTPAADPPIVEVLRLLHDSMDLSRRVETGRREDR